MWKELNERLRGLRRSDAGLLIVSIVLLCGAGVALLRILAVPLRESLLTSIVIALGFGVTWIVSLEDYDSLSE